MYVTVSGGADADRSDKIKAAASEEWNFDHWDEFDGTLTASGDDKLCASETDQEFAERLARVVWKANGGPCEVEVRSTYLEDLPHEDFVLDKADYERIMGQTVSAADGG
jgi:hypothetical protein